MADKDVLGRAGEHHAAEHLAARGWTLLDRNWRCAQGEIDIVALDGSDVVAVEVKTRRGLLFGHPFEAVTEEKIERLNRLIRAWAHHHPEAARGRSLRVDAIAIVGADPATGTIEHIRDVRGMR